MYLLVEHIDTVTYPHNRIRFTDASGAVRLLFVDGRYHVPPASSIEREVYQYMADHSEFVAADLLLVEIDKGKESSTVVQTFSAKSV